MTEETSPEPSPAEVAQAEISALKTDTDFAEAFVGKQGREAQREAVERKSALHQAAYGKPDATSPALPERVEAALDDQSNINKAAGEAMTPAQDPSDYKFNWEGAGDMDTADLQAMTDVVSATAFAIGAPSEYTKATVEFIDRNLANPIRPDVEYTADHLVEALNSSYGEHANDTVQAARALIDKMPEQGRDLFTDALDRLEPKAAAWVVGRLASIHRSQS